MTRFLPTRESAMTSLAVTLIFGANLFPTPTLAQLTPDDSLGGESSQVTPNAIVDGRSTDLIEGGAVRGPNLFHSFSEFNVGNRARVYFANPAGIDTILTRVTGGNSSFINGTLGVDGAANLYLLNPNGVVFGRNARLDIDGAFAVSTANAWNLDDGGVFSASNPNAPPLLTVNLTPGLQYSADQQGDVVNDSARLQLNAQGQVLTLLGETIVSTGALGRDTVILRADEDIRLDEPMLVDSITAIAGETVFIERNVSSNPGSINISGNQIMVDASLRAQNGGDITLTATEQITVDNRAQLDAGAGFLGFSAGDINISTLGELRLQGGGRIQASSSISGDSGLINIQAQSVVIDGTPDGGLFSEPSRIELNAGITGGGQGGASLNIDTDTLSVINGGGIVSTGAFSVSFGQSNSSLITIQARSITVDGGHNGTSVFNNSFTPSRIQTDLGRATSGLGGNILIQTDTLAVTNGGQINTAGVRIFSIGGRSDAGDIEITASNILIDGTDETSGTASAIQALAGGTGDTGGVTLVADVLTITNGARLVTLNEASQGDSGTVQVTADQIRVDGANSEISSGVRSSSGNSGDVVITADEILATDGAIILTLNEQGAGRSGDIYVTASHILLEGVNEQPTMGSVVTSSGGGGNLIIVAEELLITNGAIIEAFTGGLGIAGDISLEASRIVVDGENVTADRSSAIDTIVVNDAGGDGGDLLITVGELIVLDGAFVATRSAGQGNSGDVTIIAARVALDGASQRAGQQPSRIESLVDDEGDGGNIALTTEELSLTNTGAIRTTNTGSGRSGELRVTATDSATLDQGSIVSGTFSQSDSGDIILNAQRLTLQNGSTIGANAAPTGDVGDADPAAGTIDVTANAVTLDRSAIATEGTLGGGGNVFVFADSYLLLRNGSLITTNAGTQLAGGDGGNIDIRAPFVAAVLSENSDITANAFSGSGGRVTISARDIIGLEFQEQLTPNSDITASSTLGADGVTEFNRLSNVDVQEGLSDLPVDLGDPSGLINRSCELQSSANASEFSVTGRGGLPSDPTNALDGNGLIEDLGPALEQDLRSQGSTPPAVTPTEELSSAPAVISEPQGWVQAADGSIRFYTTAASDSAPPPTPMPCETAPLTQH